MFKTFVLFAAALLTALSAGLLFAYACSVNLGLHRLNDFAYLSAMQEINLAIQNPAFFICYFGPVFLLPLSAWQHSEQSRSIAFRYLFWATLLYWFGVIGITILGNVPLNEALATFQIRGASESALAAQRAQFETPWNRFHFVRTCVAIITLALILGGLISRKKV